MRIAKLHYKFCFSFVFYCLNLFDSSRVNPLEEVYFLPVRPPLPLWLLFPFSASIRTADCHCNYHAREYIDVGGGVFRFLDTLK